MAPFSELTGLAEAGGSSLGMKAGECAKEALGRKLRARTHPASKDKRIQTPRRCRHSSREQESSSFREPCSELPSGRGSKGAGQWEHWRTEVSVPAGLFPGNLSKTSVATASMQKQCKGHQSLACHGSSQVLVPSDVPWKRCPGFF